MGRLDGKVALITGGASGMGLAACELFAAEGARVVVVDLTESGEEVAATIRAAGNDAAFVRADVASADDCAAMVAFAMKQYGGLHVLYNNAGVFPADDGGTLETPERTWDRVM